MPKTNTASPTDVNTEGRVLCRTRWGLDLGPPNNKRLTPIGCQTNNASAILPCRLGGPHKLGWALNWAMPHHTTQWMGSGYSGGCYMMKCQSPLNPPGIARAISLAPAWTSFQFLIFSLLPFASPSLPTLTLFLPSLPSCSSPHSSLYFLSFPQHAES